MTGGIRPNRLVSAWSNPAGCLNSNLVALAVPFAFLSNMDDRAFLAAGFQQTAGAAVKALCLAGKFSYGEVWFPSRSPKYGEVHKCLPVWWAQRSMAPKLVVLRKLSESIAFPDNIGIPGRTSHKRQLEWIEDVCSLPPTMFLRLELAQKLGFHAVCAVPVIVSKVGRPICVCVLWSEAVRKEDSRVVKALQDALNPFISQFSAILERNGVVVPLSASVAPVSLPGLPQTDYMRQPPIPDYGVAPLVDEDAALMHVRCIVVVRFVNVHIAASEKARHGQGTAV